MEAPQRHGPQHPRRRDLPRADHRLQCVAPDAGLAKRGELDGTPEVTDSAHTLEKVCVQTVEEGKMTKDLALLIGGDQGYLTTEEFLAALDEGLQKAVAA